MALQWHTSRIIDIQKETELTWRFFLEVDGGDSFDYTPGQFVTFDLPIADKPAKRMRSYSIASRPDGGNVFELIIVLLEDGRGTNYLFNEAKVGTEIPFRGPLGKFTLPETIEQDICFVCTGTGIAPFRSQILDLHFNKKPHKNLHLIFGTRLEKDMLYKEELTNLQKEMPGFHFLPTLSREKSASWEGKRGYVHAVYEELIEQNRNMHFYLCGWRVMIDESRKRLASHGYDRKSIHFELYD